MAGRGPHLPQTPAILCRRRWCQAQKRGLQETAWQAHMPTSICAMGASWCRHLVARLLRQMSGEHMLGVLVGLKVWLEERQGPGWPAVQAIALVAIPSS